MLEAGRKRSCSVQCFDKGFVFQATMIWLNMRAVCHTFLNVGREGNVADVEGTKVVMRPINSSNRAIPFSLLCLESFYEAG
jgi:hypothetical protein